MTGALLPGTFIRLDETAAALGVSITPVREALRTLRGEGMVLLEPHRGHVVAPLTPAGHRGHLLAAGHHREGVRGCRNGADHRRRDRRAGPAQRRLAGAVEHGDPEDIAAAEFAFHWAFNQSTGRIKLAWFLLHIARYMPPQMFATDPQWGVEAVAEHAELIDALRRRDGGTVVGLTKGQFDGRRATADRVARGNGDLGLSARPA